ncbi:hypothetical protein [Micromonospora okii]|uniref:hypothetical protein n=1 Tax=Micromonospora okii TaxID=1182970 RepID=UPI001E2F9F05|nr:hypothetical protein [Micromonospora okii]
MGSATRLGTALAVAIGAAAGPLPATVARAAGTPGTASAWAPGFSAVAPAGFTAVAPAAAPAPEPPGGGQQPGWVFVEVTPGTVQPGYLVGIRASCRDNTVPAIVVSDAFGRVAVHAQRGVLVGTPMVHERTRPGNYRVKLECRDGETATTMLQVVKKTPSPAPTHSQPDRPTHRPAPHPSRGPNTGFGGAGDDDSGGLLLPGGVALTIAGVTIGLVAARRPRARRGAYRG